MTKTVIVTGGAGFIGSALCRRLAADSRFKVVNVDKLTYAASLSSLRSVEKNSNYRFVEADICDFGAMLRVMRDSQADVIIHLAAESHVDRSIDGPAAFIETNIIGTFHLLNAALSYWRDLKEEKAEGFRFHHVSTDEVFGDLPCNGGTFAETTPYAPSSPYSASKAASDHLVHAWHKTYGLPVTLSNCSNNYGPFHFPEKLIPLMILNALEEKPLPVYGKGENIRDWLYVEDHAAALERIVTSAPVGQSYNIGGRAEQRNIDVTELICATLDEMHPRRSGAKYNELITFVADRPGHDRRYAIDPSKIESELGWTPTVTFETGIVRTIEWFLANRWWWEPLRHRYSGVRLGQAV